MRRTLVFAAIVLATLLSLAFLVWWASPILPGFRYKERAEDYWIAFWSALAAGLILTAPIAALVAVLLSIWERGNRAREALQDTLRELEITKELLKYPLSLPVVRQWRWQTFTGLIEMAPKGVKECVAILATRPLHYWQEQLRGRRDHQEVLRKMMVLQTAYLDYAAKEATAAIAFDQIAQSVHGNDPDGRLKLVIPSMAKTLGTPRDGVSREVTYEVFEPLEIGIEADNDARRARDAFAQANTKMLEAVVDLKKALGIP